MDEIVPYLAPTIPDYIWYTCFGFVSVVALVTIRICDNRKTSFGWTCFAILLAYLVLVFCNTVFLRNTMEEPQYRLQLFWSYYEHEDGLNQRLEILLNILLFAPIGVLSGCLTKKVRWWHVLLFAFSISLSIEALQLLLKRGIFEFDDMMHNTLGAILGYLPMAVVSKLFTKLKV